MITNTNFIGKQYLHFKELDSTNTFLQHWAQEAELAEGAAVSALVQTNGRGQRGTSWVSNPGENILTSVLFKPHFLRADEQFWLSKTIALGVKDFMMQLLPAYNVRIKWPNDIYINNQKAAGILIENTIQSNTIRSCIAGIGININQLTALPARSVSVKQLNGIQYELNHLLPMLYMALEEKYYLLKQGNYRAIDEMYKQSLYGYGEKLLFTDNILKQTISGTITGTTAYGQLCLDTEFGLKTYDLKEISLL